MIKFWQNCKPREKGLIAFATLLFILLVGWQVILKPLITYPNTQKQIFEQAVTDLAIVKAGTDALRDANPLTPKTNLTALEFQSTIIGSASQHDLNISRRQPKGAAELSIWMENVSATSFYAWVDELTRTYNIAVQQVSLFRNGDGSIRVNIAFMLEV